MNAQTHFVVWNEARTEGFITTDYQLAYEVRKSAESNCCDEDGRLNKVAVEFCERHGAGNCTLQAFDADDMRWKRSPPTTPGFYYWQGGHLTGRMVAVVQVSAFKDRTREMEARELLIDPGHPNAPQSGPVSSWGGIWAGPLPQPVFSA